MKLLVLASRFPYPIEKGDKLRLYYQIKALSKYHEIVLCALTEESVSTTDLEALEPYCTTIYTFPRKKWTIGKNLTLAAFKGLPFQIGYFYEKSIHQQLKAIIKKENPDHIYAQLIRVASYLQGIETPKTIDYMDAFSLGTKRWSDQAAFWLKPILRREAKALAKYEATVFKQFDHHTIISAQDRDLLQFESKHQIEVIENGVDTDFFKPNSQIEKKYDIAFVGNMGYRPNVEAVRYFSKEILPLLLPKYPNIKVLIAGARPTAFVKNLASEHITVSGWIEDIRTAYASAKMIAAPLFIGSGQQNKILEAMAMGIPCVTTTLVNNAIQATPESAILIANDAQMFQHQIERLLESTELRKEISKSALIFVHNNFSWTFFVEKLNKLIIE